MAPLLSIFDKGGWPFGNFDALLLLVTFVDNAIDDQKLSVIGEEFRENAVVSRMGGGV